MPKRNPEGKITDRSRNRRNFQFETGRTRRHTNASNALSEVDWAASNHQDFSRIMSVNRIWRRNPFPLPNEYNCAMPWCIQLSLSSSSTTSQFGAENYFQLNGLFDPDGTGGTHQPYGFDQLAAQYRKYMVVRTEVLITVFQPYSGSSSTVNGMLGYMIQPAEEVMTMVGKPVSDVFEIPASGVMFIPPIGGFPQLRLSADMASVQGVTRFQYKAEEGLYAGTSTANPSKTPYLRIACANASSTAVITVGVLIRCVFHVRWYERINLAPSN